MRDQHARITRLSTATAVVMALALGAFGSLFARPRQTDPAAAANQKGNATMEETGFYCNINALTKAERERHKQLTGKLNEAKLESTELPDGFAFRLQSAKLSLPELAEWISAESKCCPFFDFEIELERNNGPLWLKLRGRDGVKQFMRSELSIH